MQIKYLRPAPGRSVPDPERHFGLLPATGRRVEMTTYWQRRIDENDVVEVDEQETASEAAGVQPNQA